MALEEEKFNKKEISSLLQNFLTLRYDPFQQSLLPNLTHNDFQPTETELSTKFLESKMQSYILNSIPSSTKKISISLSGGIDSTMILALLRKTLPDVEITAFSLRFADSIDETSNAKNIADHFNADFKIINIENYLLELPAAIQITKLPFWDIHWFYVVVNAQQNSSFLASGDGGDELFGGYTFRYSKFLSLIKPNSSTLEKVIAYLSCHERDWVPDQEKLFSKDFNFSWLSIYNIFQDHFNNSLSPINQLFLADYNGKLLHNFSIISNRINNNFNIKSITPILSNDIIHYSSHLPPEVKYDPIQNIGKLPLREILRKYNVDSLVSKEKLGFSVNTQNLWKSIGKDLCELYVENGRLIENNLIDKDWILKYIKKSTLDVRYVNKFLGLLSFEIWYRLFVSKEITSNLKLC